MVTSLGYLIKLMALSVFNNTEMKQLDKQNPTCSVTSKLKSKNVEPASERHEKNMQREGRTLTASGLAST